ncbi:WXG100 family type VII secretion target [Actinomadura chibensis]|uniref:WXG100 family type VII secretion target n=1 Tax=Actinomadura chibensis TaxID=392828 RepID=A0A5D0N980_9ACTN|nr:WXG100 family type VII secretion target [Actinomadura chibensis]TYB40886.1 WXG100 family type VII secretion target [Actinomadura chibensis]
MGDERFQVPIRSNTDNGQQWSGDMDAMHQLFAGINPERVIKAGRVFRNVSNRFESIAGALRTQSSALAAVWNGDDADATITQMRKLQRSAENIYQVSGRTAWVLTEHGEKLDWYKEHLPKEGFFKGLTWDQAGIVTGGTLLGGPVGGLIGLSKGEALGLIKHTESKAAVEYVQRLSDHAREANAAMPTQLDVELPQSQVSGGLPPNTPPGDGVPGGGLPGGGGGVPGGGPGGIPAGGGGGMPGGIPGGGGLPSGIGGGGGSDLAGLPGGGGVDPFGKGGLPGGGLPGGGGIPGGGAGGMAGGVPGGLLGSGSTSAGRGGVGGGRGLGKAGLSGRGGMGAPMGGGRGGGGNGEDEHERTTWLTEDEDVWGGNDGDTTPPVIG